MPAALPPGAVVAIVAGAVLLLYVVLTFNAFVRLRNRVREAFSGVDVQLRRRHDLVPNLVKTVGAYAKHERETLDEVVAARSEAGTATVLADRERTENGLSRRLDRLLLLVERYPELKADANFRRLHADLVELEDHLQYARRYYNGTVRDLNTKREQFPGNLLAGLFGVRREAFFEIDEPAARGAPTLSFDAPARPGAGADGAAS